MYTHPQGYGNDDDTGVFDDIYGAYGYRDDYSDGPFSDMDDFRNFWFQNDTAERTFQDNDDDDDAVAEASIEEVESNEENAAPTSQRLLLGKSALKSSQMRRRMSN